MLLDNYYNAERARCSPSGRRQCATPDRAKPSSTRSIRKNYGVTHFIVGRDHAGVGKYYGTYDAQRNLRRIRARRHRHHAAEVRALVLVQEERRHGHRSKTTNSAKEDRVFLSGTKVREMLAAGERPPIEFTRRRSCRPADRSDEINRRTSRFTHECTSAFAMWREVMKQTASLILMFGLCAAASAESFEYHYFKTPITLVPIGTRLAVHSTSLQSSDQLSASFEKASLELSHIEAMPIAGWSLATTIQPAADQQDLRNRISQWLASNDNGYVSPVFLGNDGGQVMIAPQILIGFDPDVDPQQIVTLIQDECGSGSIIELLDASQRLYKVELPAVRSGLTVLEHANALAMRDLVHMSEPDMIFTGTSGGLIPNDTGFGNCWGLHNTGQSGGTVDADMDAPEAWDVTTGDPNIIVVVLDTGVDTSHPDLNWIPGIDTTSDGGDGNPVNSLDNHGTPVAGCVACHHQQCQWHRRRQPDLQSRLGPHVHHHDQRWKLDQLILMDGQLTDLGPNYRCPRHQQQQRVRIHLILDRVHLPVAARCRWHCALRLGR
jgi:hypothetical protein